LRTAEMMETSNIYRVNINEEALSVARGKGKKIYGVRRDS